MRIVNDNKDLNYVYDPGGLVKEIVPTQAVEGFLSHWQELLAHPKVKPIIRKEAKGHFHSLSGAAILLNERLDIAGTPYHFTVYEKEGEISVEMMMLDADGNTVQESLRTITHEEFHKWISNFDEGEGLLFDQNG